MTAVYILLAGLILTLPAAVCSLLYWGTPLAAPLLVGFSFAYAPFVAAACLHRQIREMTADAGH
ncbi:MAG TPA: hypothetical protein VNZ57_13970 [Longimicrobiales bacterium]|nr:hypothetical protein [Longimicrobiales bacterium]